MCFFHSSVLTTFREMNGKNITIPSFFQIVTNISYFLAEKNILLYIVSCYLLQRSNSTKMSF